MEINILIPHALKIYKRFIDTGTLRWLYHEAGDHHTTFRTHLVSEHGGEEVHHDAVFTWELHTQRPAAAQARYSSHRLDMTWN